MGRNTLSAAKVDTAGSPGRGPADPGKLLNEHWTPVYRLLLSLTGNTHEAEDLTQETFLRALQRLNTFQRGTNLRGWMLRIATNAFFDARRKRKRPRTEALNSDPYCPAPPAGQAMETRHQCA